MYNVVMCFLDYKMCLSDCNCFNVVGCLRLPQTFRWCVGVMEGWTERLTSPSVHVSRQSAPSTREGASSLETDLLKCAWCNQSTRVYNLVRATTLEWRHLLSLQSSHDVIIITTSLIVTTKLAWRHLLSIQIVPNLGNKLVTFYLIPCLLHPTWL